MIISIDFDGTICRGPYPEIGAQQPLAAKTIEALAHNGHYIIINTCRTGDMLVDAVNWMLEHGIKFNRVNDNHSAGVALYGSNSRKIFADVYIDDRNLGGFSGWPQTYLQIIELEKSRAEKQPV